MADNTLRRPVQDGVAFAQAIGATTLADLRTLSGEQLLNAYRPGPGQLVFGPIVDGAFLPESPAQVFAAGRQAPVPLLAGWNSQESEGRGIVPNPTPEAFAAALTSIFGDRAAEALRVYPGASVLEVMRSATDLATDRGAYASWKWLEEQARLGLPTYRYYYTHPFPRPQPVADSAASAGTAASAAPNAWVAFPRGAGHGAELLFALGNLSLHPRVAWTDDDRKVSETMLGYFVNFVKTGNPNGPGLPPWPDGRPDARGRVMRLRIDVETRAEPEPRDRYLLLQSIYAPR